MIKDKRKSDKRENEDKSKSDKRENEDERKSDKREKEGRRHKIICNNWTLRIK